MATNTLKILKFPDPRLRTVAKKSYKIRQKSRNVSKRHVRNNV